jgi:hypothetical protein
MSARALAMLEAPAQAATAKTTTIFPPPPPPAPPPAIELQLRLLRRRFAMPPELARALAGLAFATVEARA